MQRLVQAFGRDRDAEFSHHWGMWNQGQIDGKTDRQMERQTDGWTDGQTDEKNCKLLYQIIFNLRSIWHLQLKPFRNESNLEKKVLINNPIFVVKTIDTCDTSNECYGQTS